MKKMKNYNYFEIVLRKNQEFRNFILMLLKI